MKELKGYEKAKTRSEGISVPPGGYKARIIDCAEKKAANGSEYLCFYFDIIDGDFKNFYELNFKADTNPDKKWKGFLNVFVPDENSEFYENSLINFKTMNLYFEESNKNFKFDWNVANYKNCEIGIIYGFEEFETSDGDIINISRPRFFTSVERIEKGSFKLPRVKKLKKKETTSNPFDFEDDTSNDKLPWDN